MISKYTITEKTEEKKDKHTKTYEKITISKSKQKPKLKKHKPQNQPNSYYLYT